MTLAIALIGGPTALLESTACLLSPRDDGSGEMFV